MDSQVTSVLRAATAPWSPWAAIRSRPMRVVLGLVAFLLAYGVAYHFGMAFSPAVAAPFWFPDSVLLCALLCTRTRWWWLLLLATLPIRLALVMPADLPWWFLGGVYLNDCAKGVVAALLLKRALDDPIRLNSMRDLGFYCLIAVALVPFLSALAGAAARSGLGHPFWTSGEQWLLGNAMAHLVITPMLFYWVLRPPNPATFTSVKLIEAGALGIGLLVSLSLAFEQEMSPHAFGETRYYAPVPFMVWAAIRFRMYGATAAVALLTIFSLGAALDRAGSFSDASAAEISSRLQHFLLLRVAPLYLAAVLIEQWSRVSDSLRDSERRFRIIADQAPMMMWTSDTAAGCEFANRRWLDFTGTTLEQNLGQGWSKPLHPDDVRRTYDYYLRHFHARKPVEMDYRARRHDGEYRWINVRGTPRFGANGEFMGYIGSAIDVTEQRQHEAALKRSEALYRDVVESQTAFVCRFLTDATLTFVNSAFCESVGRTRSELLGGSFVELLPPPARAAAREAVAQAASGAGRAAWECEVARPDGVRGWQSWVCHVIESAPDEAREIQAIGYDITDRRRAEEAGRQLAHAARFAVVGELTAMVAHEVNQPLCAILSNAEAAEIMLRSDSPPLDELRNILADIRQDDLRADAAIRSIRSLVHRREFHPGPVDLAETVDHVMNLVAGDALHRRVNLRRDVAPGLAPAVGDRSHLEQLLVILIVNAMDAMKETPEPSRQLLVTARDAGDSLVEIAVRDFGHGISPENMSQLFDSLFTTKAEGMGLGLPIARTIVAAHGGRIWAENAPGGGAVFRFTLRTAATPAG
jgi:PAS domain S-box-containing protein